MKMIQVHTDDNCVFLCTFSGETEQEAERTFIAWCRDRNLDMTLCSWNYVFINVKQYE